HRWLGGVMLGNSRGPVTDQQVIYAVKVDARDRAWQHYYGASVPGDKTAKDIELHSDGRIIIVGKFVNGANDSDVSFSID
ncbi:MAG: hypothetical protein IPJ20_18440, partial [Flammeovirgaceae bacterium]|nr:hypothetical protein [Flammeovirgaceae bacterium]